MYKMSLGTFILIISTNDDYEKYEYFYIHFTKFLRFLSGSGFLRQ